MSVLPPPDPNDETAFQEKVDHEVDQVDIPEEMPEPPVKGQPIKDVCKNCYRPVCQVPAEGAFKALTLERFPSGWCHWDGRIDQVTNPDYHVAELFVQPPVRWGFLDPKGKSSFEVTQGPSKVRSGWSGGGTA